MTLTPSPQEPDSMGAPASAPGERAMDLLDLVMLELACLAGVGAARPEQGQSASPEPREPVALIREAAEALHRLEDRRLAASIRSDQAWRDEARCWLNAILAAAPQGIPQGAEADARDAARYRWLRDVGDATWRPFGLREGCSADLADAAIDAAISQGEQKP